jgi:hypothetical protein
LLELPLVDDGPLLSFDLDEADRSLRLRSLLLEGFEGRSRGYLLLRDRRLLLHWLRRLLRRHLGRLLCWRRGRRVHLRLRYWGLLGWSLLRRHLGRLLHGLRGWSLLRRRWLPLW